MLLGLSSLAKTVGMTARRNPIGLFVRGGRFLYVSSVGVLSLALYTGWKNQNNGRGFLETLQTGKWTPQDADKPLPGNTSNNKVAGAGPGINGDSQTAAFNQSKYNQRLQAISVAGQSFGVSVTSGKRSTTENTEANGVTNSLHLIENGALAFDLSSGPGAISGAERSFYQWASSRSDLFQEVILHNSGSGWHVHVAFRPDVVSIPSMTQGRS